MSKKAKTPEWKAIETLCNNYLIRFPSFQVKNALDSIDSLGKKTLQFILYLFIQVAKHNI